MKNLLLFMILSLPLMANAQTERKLINIGSPIFYVAPVFPTGVMPSNEKVRLSFTVLEDGSVDAGSIMVFETSNVLYNQSAIDALSQFRYNVRMENGKPVKSPNSRTAVEYKINIR